MEYLSVIELETLSNLTFDGTKTSNKLPSVLSTSKEEPEKGPKIINFTDGSHGYRVLMVFMKFSSSMPKESSSKQDRQGEEDEERNIFQ